MAYRSQAQREAVIAIVNALVQTSKALGSQSITEETLNKALDAYLMLVQPPRVPGDSVVSEDYASDTADWDDGELL